MARDIATIWSYQEQRRAAPSTGSASAVPPPRLNFCMDGYSAQPGLLDRLQSIDRTEGVQALAKELRDSGALLRLAGVFSAGSTAGGDKGAAACAPAATPSPRSGTHAAGPRFGVGALASPDGGPPPTPTALPADGAAPGSAAPVRTGQATAAASPLPAPGCSLQAALEAAAPVSFELAAAEH